LENFSSTQITIIFILLSIVLFFLGIYLGILISKLKSQKRQMNEIKQVQLQARKEREQFIKNSIIIISRATVQDQCELSEACIRIKKLLENYPELESKTEYSVIQQMYQDLSSFDYLEARSQLSSQEKYGQDKKRFKVEDTYRSEMLKSLNLLIQHFEANQ